MRHHVRLIGLGLLFAWLTSVVHGQPTAPVLIQWAAGDLYAVPVTVPGDGTAALGDPRPLTTGGLVADPALSPDETRLVYRQPSAIALAALADLAIEGFIAAYDLPMDILITDLAGTTTVIAQQDAAAVFDGTTANTALLRSAPVWSPDGAAIAWVEYPFGAATAQIVRWSLSDGTRTTIDGVPIAGQRTPTLRWNADGLLIGGSAPDGTGLDLLAYDRAGLPLYAGRYTPPAGRAVRLFDWVTGMDGMSGTESASGTDSPSVIGVLLDDGTWALFDRAGTVLTGTPVLTAAAPDARRVRFGLLPEIGWYWEAVDPLRPDAAAAAFPAPPEAVALADGGRLLVSTGYPNAGGLGLWVADLPIVVPVARPLAQPVGLPAVWQLD